MVKPAAKEKSQLQAEKRKIIGHQVKKLRREGILPANIYGKKVKSLAVQLDLKSFLLVLKKVGETGLVELKVKGETKVRPVLIHNVQFHPVSDQPLHADFYEVDLKTKVTTGIPVELIGESLAVKEKSGVLIQPLTEVEVEALPTDLPDNFGADLSQLKEIGNMIMVGDLKVPKGVKILTGLKQVLVKIEPPTKEEEALPKEGVPAEETAEETTVEKVPEREKPAEEKKPTEGEPSESKVEKKEKKQ